MIDFTRARTLISIEMDSSKYREGAKAAETATNHLNASVGRTSETASRMQDAIEKMAAGASGGLDRLGIAFKSVKSGVGGMLSGIDGMAKAMAPWNQALELGGKVAQFADAAMGAYAKTSKQAAKEVAEIRDEFDDLKRTVMVGAGEMAVGLLKPVHAMELWKAKQEELLRLYSPGYAAKADAAHTTATGFTRALTGEWINDAKRALMNASDPWDQSILDRAESHYDAFKKRLEADSKRHAAMIKAVAKSQFSDVASVTGYDTAGPVIGYSLGSAANYEGRISFDKDYKAGVAAKYGDDLNAQIEKLQSDMNATALAKSVGEHNQRVSYLEQVLGPIDQFDEYSAAIDAAKGTFNSFTDAVGAGYEALVGGKGSVIGAMKDAAAARIMFAGKESIIDAARETALGFGSLALGPLGGTSAAGHFKSAAMHAAVATAAGIAAHGLGSSGSSGGSYSSSSGGSSGGSGSYSSGSSDSSKPTVINYYIVGDSMSEDSPRMRQRNAERVVALADGTTSAGRAK